MIDRGDIPTGTMVANNVGDPSLQAAYDALFPDPSYKAGALIMPQRTPEVIASNGLKQPGDFDRTTFRVREVP